jgi:hypothetical protein
MCMCTTADRLSLAMSAIEEGGGTEKLSGKAMNLNEKNQQPLQFQTARRCGARTRSGKPCRSPATKKGRCRLHGGASGSGGPPGKRNGQYRHGERTKGAIAERRKFSALLKMLRAGLT